MSYETVDSDREDEWFRHPPFLGKTTYREFMTDDKTNEQENQPTDVKSNYDTGIVTFIKGRYRILCCCRDLHTFFGDQELILYKDLQKVYEYQFESPLNQSELEHLFDEKHAKKVLSKFFHESLEVIETADKNGKKTMSLKLKGNINAHISIIENDNTYGEMDIIPPLSSLKIASAIATPVASDVPSVATIRAQPSRTTIMKLRQQGFARENFDNMPRVRNPRIKQSVIVAKDSEDEYTEDSDEEEEEEEEIVVQPTLVKKIRQPFYRKCQPVFPKNNCCENDKDASSDDFLQD